MNAAAGPGTFHNSAAASAGEIGRLSEDESESPDDRLSGLVDGELLEETTPPTPTGRRGARVAAVQALYESDVTDHPAASTVRRMALEAGLAAGPTGLAEMLVSHVDRDRARLDERIAGAAPAFPTNQLAAVDRNVLRVALAELEACPDTPPSVVVNEAVEVAKLLGSEGAPGFVNGVLGSMLR